MKTQELNTVRFAPKTEDSFVATVTKKVNNYFETNHVSHYANTEMWIKTVVMLLLYFVPYFFMVIGSAAGKPWLFFALWFLMGWGMLGIGTSVMHDANHGTYSKNKKINNFIGD